jgi:glyceraldehyde 3-phosphate dehydrogenase
MPYNIHMKKIKVAINGFGRIGRAFYKLAKESPELEVVAVNDLTSKENVEYLLKYDSVYGQSKHTLGGVKYISEKDPTKLPWKELDIDIVVESTGLFTSSDKAQAHIVAGAKRVVVTAPIKDDNMSVVKGETVLMAMNEDKLSSCQISSNASCTTNAGSPLLAILDEAVGVEKALLNTVHAYTASQSIVDGPSKKDMREGRAAAQNIVPSSTGAAIAVTKIMTNLQGLFDGISIRVPVVSGSIVDITFISKKNTTTEEVNEILKKASNDPRWKGIFTVTEEDLVSSDIKGNPHASIADLAFTRVVGGNLVKVLAWYDNEIGYTNTLVRHVVQAGRLL